MSQPTQCYENHRRYFPLYHFVAMPILAANVVVALTDLLRQPGLRNAWYVVFAFGVLAGVAAARVSVLTVQDRLIGLEMRLRLAAVLPDDLRPHIADLRLHHLVALRFAGDEELPQLVRRCLAGELRSPEEVKRQIRSWRPDFVRA